MITPAENARLLGWVRHVLPWAGLTDRERQFLIAVQGQLKRRPGMVLSEKQAPWLAAILARFQAETFSDSEVTE